jgi:hypothetical protein
MSPKDNSIGGAPAGFTEDLIFTVRIQLGEEGCTPDIPLLGREFLEVATREAGQVSFFRCHFLGDDTGHNTDGVFFVKVTEALLSASHDLGMKEAWDQETFLEGRNVIRSKCRGSSQDCWVVGSGLLSIVGGVGLQWVDAEELVQLKMHRCRPGIIIGPRLGSQSEHDLSGLVGKGCGEEFLNLGDSVNGVLTDVHDVRPDHLVLQRATELGGGRTTVKTGDIGPKALGAGGKRQTEQRLITGDRDGDFEEATERVKGRVQFRETSLELDGFKGGSTEGSLQNTSVRGLIGDIAHTFIEPHMLAMINRLRPEVVIKNVLHRLRITKEDTGTSVEFSLCRTSGWRLGKYAAAKSAKER